jgi:hypothetical protein
VGPTAGLDVSEKTAKFHPARNGTINRPGRCRVTLPTQRFRLRHVFVSRLDCEIIENVSSSFQAKNRQKLRKF